MRLEAELEAQNYLDAWYKDLAFGADCSDDIAVDVSRLDNARAIIDHFAAKNEFELVVKCERELEDFQLGQREPEFDQAKWDAYQARRG